MRSMFQVDSERQIQVQLEITHVVPAGPQKWQVVLFRAFSDAQAVGKFYHDHHPDGCEGHYLRNLHMSLVFPMKGMCN